MVELPRNATHVERAVVVPLKPIVPVKPAPPHPEHIASGGDKAPCVPGGYKAPGILDSGKTPAELAPLLPGDKNPTSPVDKVPDNGAPARPVVDEPGMWCVSDALDVLTR
jgi:hypothetical protein